VFNLKQMREDGVDDELIHFLNTNKVPYIDQDAVNWLNAKKGGDKALTLGVRYNECFVTGETLRPAVVHAAGCRNWFVNLDEQYRGSYWKPYEKYCQWQACRDAGIKC
jgi:lipopolysaccharide biosynthesis glycosyltransferase